MDSLLLNTPEVARILAVSPKTVYRLAEQGTLPCVRLGAKIVRFRPQAVEDLIRKGESG